MMTDTNAVGSALSLAAKAQEDRYLLAKGIIEFLDDNGILFEDDKAAQALYRAAKKFI